MTPETPRSIAGPVDFEQVIRKSRFLAHLEPVTSIELADAAIAATRKRHPDARHHCVALIIGASANQQRSNDAGEPAGTAGVPMLEVLRRRNMTDVVAIVTRYFGGVLLGAGGLARAYSSSVAQALDLATLVLRVPRLPVIVDAPLSGAGRIEHLVRVWANSTGAIIEAVEYGASAKFALLVAPDALPSLRAELASVGAPEPLTGQARIVDVPVSTAASHSFQREPKVP